MIDDEVQPRPVAGRLDHVARPAVLLVEDSQRQTFVHADVPNAELEGLFPEGIRHLLIVEPPGLFADLRAGVQPVEDADRAVAIADFVAFTALMYLLSWLPWPGKHPVARLFRPWCRAFRLVDTAGLPPPYPAGARGWDIGSVQLSGTVPA